MCHYLDGGGLAGLSHGIHQPKRNHDNYQESASLNNLLFVLLGEKKDQKKREREGRRKGESEKQREEE